MHRRHQSANAQNLHRAFHIVGQDVQRHFGADVLERFHLEVRRSHPRFYRTEGMLDRLAPLAHLLRAFVEPALHRLENVLMLPPGDPSLLAGGATVLDGAALAGVGPVIINSLWLPKTLFAAESLMISGGVVRLKVGREMRLRPHFGSCVTDGASARTGPKHELSLALDSSRRSARSPGLFTAGPEQQLLMEGVCRKVSEIPQISAADRIFGSHRQDISRRGHS